MARDPGCGLALHLQRGRVVPTVHAILCTVHSRACLHLVGDARAIVHAPARSPGPRPGGASELPRNGVGAGRK